MTYDIDLVLDESPAWERDFRYCLRAMGSPEVRTARLIVPPRKRAEIKRLLNYTGFSHVFVASSAVRCVQ